MGEEGNPKGDTWQSTRTAEMKFWVVFAFALIGATATTFAERIKRRSRTTPYAYAEIKDMVESSCSKAFQSHPDVSKAVSELTVLKGVVPAAASAMLAAYAPHVAPFMSDEAMEAALGHSKDYSLKQYLLFVEKLLKKSKELSSENQEFTPSDVERALWSSAVDAKLKRSPTDVVPGIYKHMAALFVPALPRRENSHSSSV